MVELQMFCVIVVLTTTAPQSPVAQQSNTHSS